MLRCRQLPKLFNMLICFIGTVVYYSISKSEKSLQTLLMVIIVNLLLFFSFIYSTCREAIHRNPFLRFILFLLESQEVRGHSVFVLTTFAQILILASAVISSSMISFSSEAWTASYFFSMVPIVYLLHLLEFNHNPICELKASDYFRMPFLYSLLIINGTCLLILSEIPLTDTSEIKKITGVLVTFGTILCGYLYFLVLTSKFSKYLSLFTTFVLYVVLAVALVNGSEFGDEEIMKVCLFFAAAIPISLLSTSVYFRYDISSQLKNSFFLCLWTLLFVPSMSLLSDDYLSQNHTFFCNVVNFSFLAFGFYCLLLETMARFQQVEDREDKNILILCFVVLPLGIAAAFFSFDRLPVGLLGTFIGISLGVVFLGFLFFWPVKILTRLVSRVSSKSTESVLWYDDILILMFSILWKLLYLLSICFMTRKLYFFDFEGLKTDFWVVTQGVLILLSAMGHSSILENVNFFVQEIEHEYPSVRKLSIVDQVVPSLLRDSFEPVKKMWQLIILVIFLIVEVISLACIAASKSMYFMSIFNLVTAVLFIVAFETKLKTWNNGNKISAEFLVFLWTCIYIPCVCGSSVISTTSIAGNIDATSSLIIFFIIISFCIQLGLFSGELYDKISSLEYVKMNLMLKNKGFSINYRNLIIEDFKNKNLKNFEIIDKGNQSYNDYVSEHFSFVCRKCRLGVDHDVPGLYYESNNYELQRILKLQPVLDKVFEPEPEVQEEVLVEKPPERLDINNTKLIAFKEFFGMQRNEEVVKKFNFVNNLADVYHEKIEKGRITRDDFFIVFLGVTHDVSKQVLLKFDSVFVKKVLRGLARLIYGKIDEATMIRVEKDLLTKPVLPPAPVVKEEKFLKIPPKKNITAKASKAYLSINVTTKNLIDYLIPYSLINLTEKAEEQKFTSIKMFLDELNKEADETDGEAIDAANISIQLLFFASIFNMYSLTSVALTSEISWLESKLPLSTGVIPAESSWLVSVILSFSLIFLFLVLTLTLFLLIKYKKTSNRMIQWGKSMMIVVASGLLVENLIFLLSNLMCESTNGKLHIQNNENIECMGSVHLGLFSVSIVLFVVYFFLVQVFFPSFYKLSTRVESYFNIEVHCKVIYSAIASCISNELLGFKLVLCLCLGIVLVVYSFYRIRTGENKEKFQEDFKEYLIVVWIYVWALLLYNGVVAYDGFIVLIVTISVYSVYAQRKCFAGTYRAVRNCCNKNTLVTPQIDEVVRLNDLNNTTIKSPGIDTSGKNLGNSSSASRKSVKTDQKAPKTDQKAPKTEQRAGPIVEIKAPPKTEQKVALKTEQKTGTGKTGKGTGKVGVAKTGNQSKSNIKVTNID